MKRSIKRKIILSYLFVVLASLSFVAIFFNFAAQKYAENQAKKNLKEDAKTISYVYRHDSDLVKRDSSKIQGLMRDTVKVNKLGLETEGAFVVRDLKGSIRVMYPRKESGEGQVFFNDILPAIKEHLKTGRIRGIKINTENENYFAVIHPVMVNTRLKTFVVLYIEAAQVRELTKGVLGVLFVALLFSALVAVVIGVLFARNITLPIIKLEKQAERLSKRDFDSKVNINTGDEIEELAGTINKMALELKEYDIAQKKFLQNASHELKTPLMSIQGYAEGLKDGVFDNCNEALDIIVEETARLKGIVDDLIFLSKLETMEDFYHFRKDSINEIIDKSVEKVRSIAFKKGIRVNTMLYKDAKINCDRLKMIQAIINILSNSIRHARSEVDIITSNNEQWVEIRICDDGEGFPEGEANKIFERFYKGKKGDTGLGLAITKTIVEKHGGTIQAGNSSEGGAQFSIKLPIK